MSGDVNLAELWKNRFGPTTQYLLSQQAKFAAESARLEVFGCGKSLEAERARGLAASYAESVRRYGAK